MQLETVIELLSTFCRHVNLVLFYNVKLFEGKFYVIWYVGESVCIFRTAFKIQVRMDTRYLPQ